MENIDTITGADWLASPDTPETDAAHEHREGESILGRIVRRRAAMENLERQRDELLRLLKNVLRGDDGHDWKEASQYISENDLVEPPSERKANG